MRNIWTIIKKELKRFFTDKRILVSLFLPGILIYFVYSFMGDFMKDSMSTSDDYVYNVYVQNKEDAGDVFSQMLTNTPFTIAFQEVEQCDSSVDEIKNQIRDKEVDLLVVFEKDFYNNMLVYQTQSNTKAPNIEIYYNSAQTSSSELFYYYSTVFNEFEATMTNKFDINNNLNNSEVKYDLVTEEQTTIMFITMLLPFLLITFLFTASMSVTPDSIAGEKERGTIATLLVTPMRRRELALGKTIAISIAALASSLVSFVGLILSLPKLMQMASIDLGIYGISTYLSIFAIVLVTELLFVVLISLVSAFAKSVKEATGYCSALMIVIMLLGVSTMVGISGNSTIAFLFPVYNSIQCLNEILSLSFNLGHFFITILANLVLIVLGTIAITKIFNSEKILSNA